MEANYFKIDKDKIVFDYVERFESGEDDCLHGEFSLDDYKKGIENLNGNRNCELSGNGCSMRIFSKNGLIEILFSGCNQSFLIGGLEKANLV